MFSLNEVIPLVISVFGITINIFAGFVGFNTYRGNKVINFLFLAIFLSFAWVNLWLGLVHGGLLKNHLQLYGASQSISGFTAPLIFLYTLTIFKKEEKLPKKMYLVLFFGLFGTWFSVEIFNSTTEEILHMMTFKEAKLSTVNFSEVPLASYLYILHAFENGLFIVMSNFYALYKFFTTKNKMEKWQAFYLFLPLLAALMASTMIHFLDYLFAGIETQKYAGLTSLPVTILIYLSLSYKNKLIESSFKKNKKISIELEKHKVITLMSQMFVHDFRKPFNQMKAILSNIQDYAKDYEKLGKAKNEINRSIKSVNDMIDEVLQFSKKKDVLLKPISLFQTFRYVLNQLRRIYPNEEIQFHFNFRASHMPLGENSSLTRTISNIVFNAVEAILIMSKKKSGHIFLKTRSIVKEGESFIEILIENDGPLIPEHKIESIFDPFVSSGKKTGTGLGLAICKKSIEECGGKIKAINLKDKKLVQFSIFLPSSKEDELKKVNWLRSNLRENSDQGEEEKRSINKGVQTLEEVDYSVTFLFLEKSAFYHDWIKNLMEESMFANKVNTIFCSTIEEALSKFQENQVDLFSFDIRGEEEKVLKDFFDKVDPFINQTLFITYYKSLERVPHYFREKKEIGVISRPLTSEGLLGFLGEKGKNLSLKNCEINREGNQKCRVYICEDSDLLRNYYSTTIEEWFEENNKRIPFEVMSFSTGEDLIKEAQAKPPDILLSDINLESAGGVMDGFDIIREIKSMNDGCSIFIISNHSKEEMGEKVLGCGAKGYLELPVEREHIVGIFSFLGINKGR